MRRVKSHEKALRRRSVHTRKVAADMIRAVHRASLLQQYSTVGRCRGIVSISFGHGHRTIVPSSMFLCLSEAKFKVLAFYTGSVLLACSCTVLCYRR